MNDYKTCPLKARSGFSYETEDHARVEVPSGIVLDDLKDLLDGEIKIWRYVERDECPPPDAQKAAVRGGTTR